MTQGHRVEYDIQSEVNSIAWKKLYLSSSPELAGDILEVIKADQGDKQLVAVVVHRPGMKPLTYNQNLKAVVENLNKSTFTIIFEDHQQNPAYATFNRTRWQAQLVYLPTTP